MLYFGRNSRRKVSRALELFKSFSKLKKKLIFLNNGVLREVGTPSLWGRFLYFKSLELFLKTIKSSRTLPGAIRTLINFLIFRRWVLTSQRPWNDHIFTVQNEIFKVVFQLKRSSYMLSWTLRAKLISSLVIPLLDYACVVYIDLTKEQNLSLQRAPNTCIRFIYSTRHDDHITPYLQKLTLHSYLIL